MKRRLVGRSLLGMFGVLMLVLPSPVFAQSQPADVVVARVVEREIRTGHRAVGSVMPIRSSTAGSAVDGRVVEFLIDLGDAVTQGQPLARLRTGTLEIELAAANAELTLRKEELAERQNGSRLEEIAEVRARMLSAEAVQKNADSNLKRMESLLNQGAANQTAYDNARETFDAAVQSLLAAEASLKLIEAGPRKEQIAQSQARVALQQEQVRLIEDRIEKFTIYAPFDGFIVAEHTEVGEWISQGDPVAEVIALNEVDLRCNVPAEQAVQLQRGRDVRIDFPDLPEEVFTGRISRVVPMADVSSRTFPVNIRLENRIVNDVPLLMPGMLARAVLPTGERSKMPLVPKDSVVLNGSRRSVFVVDTTAGQSQLGRVRAIPVSLGIADGTLIQIDAPLKSGQLVVVLGNERLEDGQDVRIVSESSGSATDTSSE